MTEIEITWKSKSPHFETQGGSLRLQTDHALEGILDAFRAALVAMGFATETAGRLGLKDE